MSTDHMQAIRDTFFLECAEQLEALESGLMTLEEGDSDIEVVNSIFRAVHSIKGGAGAFELTDVVRFAHVFESTLDLLRNGKLQSSPDLLKVMLRAADVLSDLVAAARDGEAADTTSSDALIVELEKFTGGGEDGDDEDDEVIDFQPMTISMDAMFGEEPAGPASQTFTIRFRPRKELYTSANDPGPILRELARLGEVRTDCDVSQVPNLSSFDPFQGYLTWTITLATTHPEADVRDAFDFVDGLCELEITTDAASSSALPDIGALIAAAQAAEPVSLAAAPALADEPPKAAKADSAKSADGKSADSKSGDAAKGAQSASASPTIRVELDRVDRLINLVGELVINRAMLLQRIKEEGVRSSSPLALGLDDLEQLTREIQDSVMAIRAQPVKPLFQRMSRIVREIGDITGKSVRLKTDGEATEVDKIVIERLADPLTHMIRNAVDHGIESPEGRLAAGKPVEGTIRLTAAHRSGRIIIEVADDGAGIDRKRVRETAVRKDIISEDAQLTDSEIENLLFAPGFSTAQTVSNISGRGVGMDVVKRSIQALGGRISISSVPGAGTTFTMTLPLTLAVLDGMIVNVNEQTLVIPLTAIVETLKPKPDDVHDLPGADRGLIFSRGKFVPLIDVARALDLGAGVPNPSDGVVLLVEAENGMRCGLLVDAIDDQRQVVIKSLEENYGSVPGIAAATILGNGRVALILDVDAVLLRGGADVPLADVA